MAYVSDSNWIPASGPQSGPPGPLATRNALGIAPRATASNFALLALGLGFAYWVIRPKKRPRKNPAPRRSALNDAIRSKHGIVAFDHSGRPRAWALREMADSRSVYAGVAKVQLRRR